MVIDWPSLHGDAFAARRVLVTGAAGFIGSHLCEALAALGAEIVALDDLSNGLWANLDGFAFTGRRVEASITDASAVNVAAAGCALVFHLAALGSVPRSVAEPLLFHEVNVIGAVNVLEAARAAEPLCGETLNVACGRRVTINQLHARMADLYGCPQLRPQYQPERPGDVRHSLADIARARESLQYEPLIDFDTGLVATVEWYRKSLSAS